MPFTPSHAVVALPFVGTRMVPAAIAIGAMAPDTPLFFSVGVDYEWTHSLWGMIAIDLPLALALFVVWRMLLRSAIVAISPRCLRARWPGDWWGSPADGWRTVIAAGPVGGLFTLASLVLGIATHVFWDLFTHAGRWGGEIFPALDEVWGPFDGAQWAHILSSLVALAIIGVWGWRWMSRRTPVERTDLTPAWVTPAFWVFVPLALVALTVIELVAQGTPADVEALKGLLFRVGTGLGAAIIVAGLLISLAIPVFWQRHARD